MQSRAVPVLNMDGSLRELIGVCTDITADQPPRDATGNVASASRPARKSTGKKDSLEQRTALMGERIIGVVHADAERIIEANDAFLAMLGYTQDELKAGPLRWKALLRPGQTPLPERDRQELLRQGVCAPFERLMLGKDGSTARVLFKAALVQSDPLEWISYAVDVSERRNTEQDLRALQALTDTALAHLHVEDLFREMMEQIRTLLAVDHVAILLLDIGGDELSVRATHGFDREMIMPVTIPIGRGFAGRIAATRAPLIVEDLRTFDVASPYLSETLRSVVGVPLIADDRMLGVLHAGTAQPRHFTEDEAELLQQAADRIAMALDRAHRYEETQEARRVAMERASELEATFDAIADAVVLLDVDGHILRANTSAQNLLNKVNLSDYDHLALRERFEHLTLRDGENNPITLDTWPATRVLRGEAFSGNESVDIQFPTADGSVIQVNTSGAPVHDASGEIIGGVLVHRDVTELRNLEHRTHQALAALLAMAETLVQPPEEETSTERLEASSEPARPPRFAMAWRLATLACDVLGCTRVGIVAIDPETQLLQPAAVVGLTPEQERQWWAEQQTVCFGEGADPDLLARFIAGEAIVTDMRVPPYDQIPNPYGITTSLAAPMRIGDTLVGILSLDYGGAPHQFTAEETALAAAVAKLAASVIERERLVREREEARTSEMALREANRRMDSFLHIVNHELNTPVTSLKTNIQLALRRIKRRESTPVPASEDTSTRDAQFEALRTLLERSEGQVNRLSRLLGDLIDASRLETGKLELLQEHCDLSAIVRDTVREYRQMPGARHIYLHAIPQAVTIYADGDRIRQVLSNYLSNAVKYAPASKPIDVSLSVEDGRVRVSVHDEGPGLPPKEQKRIWRRFHQVEGVAAHGSGGIGLGLGLYICRQIIEQHGGQVGVTSAVGKGSTFWFTLPLTPEAS
jgi:PAS domain S-box-containing protein